MLTASFLPKNSRRICGHRVGCMARPHVAAHASPVELSHRGTSVIDINVGGRALYDEPVLTRCGAMHSTSRPCSRARQYPYKPFGTVAEPTKLRRVLAQYGVGRP